MISLNNVTTGYQRDKPLLKNYSYVFKDGLVYGILGESGIGKTTLLRTISGLLKPLKGTVEIDGKVVKNPRNDTFMMHQQYTSFDWLDCLNNVWIVSKVNKYGKEVLEDKKKALEMLKRVGLENHVSKYPKELSGGMRQRLALARVLFANPKILLMDEPLSALDPTTRDKMQDLVLECHKKEKNTIILVTHSREEAEKMCDVIIDIT